MKTTLASVAEAAAYIDREIERLIEAFRTGIEDDPSVSASAVADACDRYRDDLAPYKERALRQFEQMFADAGGAPVTARTEVRDAAPKERPHGERLH